MKTRLSFAVSILFVLSACVKDYYGGGPGSDDIEFTENNYLYEGDLYAVYLTGELEQIDATISELEEIIANNQGNEAVFKELSIAKEQKDGFNAELQGILDLEQVGLRIPRPKPPCPNPTNCDYALFEYILTAGSVKSISLRILDENDKMIGGGKIDELSPLPETKNQVNFSTLRIEGYQDNVKVQVTVFDETGNDRMYTVGGKPNFK